MQDALQGLGQQAERLVVVEEAHERQRQQHRDEARQQHDSACASLEMWHHSMLSSLPLRLSKDKRGHEPLQVVWTLQ